MISILPKAAARLEAALFRSNIGLIHYPGRDQAAKRCNIQASARNVHSLTGPYERMPPAAAVSLMVSFTRATRGVVAVSRLGGNHAAALVGVAAAVLMRSTRQDVYNILWAVVFGFATLNILSLAARRFEPDRRGLSFGELLAVMVVLISIALLGWEMLNLFHVFPIRIRR
jgi:hypothetical protein